MCSIIAVVSGKGGTGKTTVTAALATALAQLGRKVLAADCDIGLHNLDMALGLQDGVVFDLGDLVLGRAEISDVLLPHPQIDGLSFLPAPSDYEDVADTERFVSAVRAAAEGYDYCLLDAPAGIGTGFRLAASAAGSALVVSTPDTPCLSDSAAAAALLADYGITDVRLVLNRVRPRLINRRSAANIDQSIDRIGFRLAGIVCEDRRALEAFNRCRPLMLGSGGKARRGITELACRLEGYPLRASTR